MEQQKKADHSSDEEVASEVIEDLFNDESFYKPEPLDTFDVYERKFDHKDGTPSKITIRLAGSHPLWATKLWNAAKFIAEQIDDPSTDFHPQNKTVLELGAGGALPSLIAVLRGASRVVLTDYPDKPLLYCMEHNVNENIPAQLKDRAAVVGHLWGKDIHELTDQLKKVNRSKFDAIICSDLLFNHMAHKALLETIHTCMEDDGKCYVTFSHHKVRKMKEDLVFFELAQQEPFNMKVEKVGEVKMTPMFEKDEGPAEIRATVHYYIP